MALAAGHGALGHLARVVAHRVHEELADGLGAFGRAVLMAVVAADGLGDLSLHRLNVRRVQRGVGILLQDELGRLARQAVRRLGVAPRLVDVGQRIDMPVRLGVELREGRAGPNGLDLRIDLRVIARILVLFVLLVRGVLVGVHFLPRISGDDAVLVRRGDFEVHHGFCSLVRIFAWLLGRARRQPHDQNADAGEGKP